jgi:hypothetical protein
LIVREYEPNMMNLLTSNISGGEIVFFIRNVEYIIERKNEAEKRESGSICKDYIVLSSEIY